MIYLLIKMKSKESNNEEIVLGATKDFSIIERECSRRNKYEMEYYIKEVGEIERVEESNEIKHLYYFYFNTELNMVTDYKYVPYIPREINEAKRFYLSHGEDYIVISVENESREKAQEIAERKYNQYLNSESAKDFYGFLD